MLALLPDMPAPSHARSVQQADIANTDAMQRIILHFSPHPYILQATSAAGSGPQTRLPGLQPLLKIPHQVCSPKACLPPDLLTLSWASDRLMACTDGP